MQKNFIAFMVTCLALIMGWLWMQNRLWPRRPRDDSKQAETHEQKKAPPSSVRANLIAMRGLTGNRIVEIAQLAWDLEQAKDLFPPQKVAAVKPPEKKEVKKEEKKQEKKITNALPVKQYTIGGSSTHLQAVLTTKGAGVQRLTLNHFEAADYLGLPTGRPLELIADDPYRPSFLMYHYENDTDEYPSTTLGDLVWKYEGQSEDDNKVESVVFSTHIPGQEHIKITKTYRLGPRDYHLGLLIEIERVGRGADAKELRFRYQLAGAHGLPIEGEWYATKFREAMIGMLEGTNLVRAMEDANRVSFKQGGDRVPAGARGDAMLQYAAVATSYFASAIVVDNLQPDPKAGGVDRRGILAWARPTTETQERHGQIKAIFNDDLLFSDSDGLGKYHILPSVKRHLEETKLKDGDKAVVSYYELSDGKRIATWVRAGQTPRPFMDDLTVRVISEPVELHPGDKVAQQFMLYHGPTKVRLLSQFSGDNAVDSRLVERYADTLHLRTLTDYRSPGPISWFFQSIGWTTLLIWTTSFMHWLLYWLHFVVFGNWGLSIILLTVVVRGAMFKVSKRQAQFSIKMQELGPELKKLTEKYKNDPQGRTQATMELYRKHNVHPLGGCLPILLQMPIFLGLYYALQESIHFRLAGFLWIDNLAAPDMLIWWGENIPWISQPDSQGGIFYLGPFFNLLPLAAVSLMFFQQKMMMPPPTDDQQAMQQKTMQFMMLFMGVLFYKVASGLCLYFIASSLWGLAERKLLPRKPALAPPAPTPTGRFANRGKSLDKPNGNGTLETVKGWWAKLLEEAKKK